MWKSKKFTPWEVLETYSCNGTWFCVQVRMNKRTGFKKFKVSRISSRFHVCSKGITVDAINALTVSHPSAARINTVTTL